jgi:hypothetical protein
MDIHALARPGMNERKPVVREKEIGIKVECFDAADEEKPGDINGHQEAENNSKNR